MMMEPKSISINHIGFFILDAITKGKHTNKEIVPHVGSLCEKYNFSSGKLQWAGYWRAGENLSKMGLIVKAKDMKNYYNVDSKKEVVLRSMARLFISYCEIENKKQDGDKT